MYNEIFELILYIICPVFLVGVIVWGYKSGSKSRIKNDAFTVDMPLTRGRLTLENIRRGIAIIGAAGSGKTESIIAELLKHLANKQFSGVLYDYKNFELTEIAYPFIDSQRTNFYCISFDKLYQRVNPIAPKYIKQPEDVNEVVRVLLANLLEQKEEVNHGNSKFFNDAVEGLLSGMIWRLRTDFPEYCTLPHLIALFQQINSKSLAVFVRKTRISQAMASAFLQGLDSEKQTAGVLSTLSNALKKITTPKIFYTLSADEVPLNVNEQQTAVIVSLVNNPKYESAYSPAIATILHTITKQMAVRNGNPSFILMEEAPTIRLINMHRIPATMRSYNIATIYVLQDKIQNDMMYGEKASKAILSNLSYQFFGKVNDPDTAKYYERFFEIIKKPTTSINRSHTINFDTRVTTGEKEVAKIRADVFFRLQPGEFVSFADGKEKKVRFRKPNLTYELPSSKQDVDLNSYFLKIYEEVLTIFKS